MDHGVRIFRVDNPHTKPIPFWERLIDEVRKTDPDVLWLAEAFTRPPMMHTLAQIGFSQSYTYFTWRNEKWELEEYLRELSTSPTADYMRPNFFVNTPDILHAHLQHGGPPAFKVRAVLASLLAPAWGVYAGYELYENQPVRQGSEEYLDSEKYQLRPREWNRPDSLAPYLTILRTGCVASTRRCNGCATSTCTTRTTPTSWRSPRPPGRTSSWSSSTSTRTPRRRRPSSWTCPLWGSAGATSWRPTTR